MEANLQGPLKKLAEALHRAIEQSSDVEDALTVIKKEGFQAFLLLEVTVALGQPAEGMSLADVAHALADADDESDDDDFADDDDDDELDGAEDEADASGHDPDDDDAADDEDDEVPSERRTIRRERALERRVLQLPAVLPSSRADALDDAEPIGRLEVRIAPADRDFLKALRISLD